MTSISQTRKEEIVAATLRLLARDGIAQFTTANLAKEIGFSEALIFRHFSSKENILMASLENLQQTLLSGIRAATAGPANSQEKLARLLAFNLELLGQNPCVPRLVFSDQLYLKNETLREGFQTLYLTVHNLIKQIFVQGIEEGSLRRNLDPALSASTWIGFLHSLSLELAHTAKAKLQGEPILTHSHKERISRFLVSLFAIPTSNSDI